MPKISALMPLFNGKTFIKESLESVQKQTFTDWEFIIVNDFGSDDGCAEIIRQYAEKDPRIVLVQAQERLGLAASLNMGLDMAKGEYIARVDVDDPSEPERFEKQVAYMDEHPEVSVCGVWQRSITPQKSSVQKVAYDPEELKAAMLFGCEISHCGVMLRKKDFDAHGWRYDSNYLGEDYELWKRLLMDGAVIVNIPEPLVNHRWGFGNISIAKGHRLVEEVQEINAKVFRHLGINTDQYSPELFSGWRNRPENYAYKNRTLFLQEGYCLLKELAEKNEKAGYCSPSALRKILFDRWDWVRRSAGLKFQEKEFQLFERLADPVQDDSTPLVSIVLPTFCSARTISRAIDSVQAQTYQNWELLVVNDFGSNDGTAELVKMYMWNDQRVRLIQTDERLGLAESLNLGIREAKGKYIARLDADDTSHPERFAKQVKLMESRPEVGICGTWQHHIGKGIDRIQETAVDPEEQRCRLLFWCDLCHSTLMLRRDVFLEHELFYDPEAQAEDFELWTRAMDFMEITNIPEVLGEYYLDTGITQSKRKLLATESGRITGRTLERTLNLPLTEDECRLLNGWINSVAGKSNDQARLRKILTAIWEKNQSMKVFEPNALLQTLAAKWHWAKDNTNWEYAGYHNVKTIDDVFSNKYRLPLWKRYQMFRKNNPTRSVRIKKVIKRIFRPFADIVCRLVKAVFRDCLKQVNADIEKWTWERFKRTRTLIENIGNETASVMESSFTPCHKGEVVRMLFLFQAGSFWPSWESFYNSCIADSRIDVTFALLDEDYGDRDQMHTSRDFLEQKGIPYLKYTDSLMIDLQPHVLILQTPYDQYHRAPHCRSNVLKALGARIVYIPYGIELSDTEEAHRDHFLRSAVINSWRLYTFSNRMRIDYLIHSPNGRAVRCVGHPKFDGLYQKEQFRPKEEVRARAGGRKIVLWHVHFPKIIYQDGKRRTTTPYLEEYVEFANKLKAMQEYFFIFLPHPKFIHEVSLRSYTRKILGLLSEAKNTYIELDDDYRSVLVNADYIISDRSALIIESAAVGVPVLYMRNADYDEPLTEAVRPLIESYDQGTTCRDMIQFLRRCSAGMDPKREERALAFQECIPYFDGGCGERIKEDILDSLERELAQSVEVQAKWLREQNAQMEARIAKLEQEILCKVNDPSISNCKL